MRVIESDVEIVERLDGTRGEAITADLVSARGALVEQDHLEACARGPNGESSSRRATADDESVGIAGCIGRGCRVRLNHHRQPLQSQTPERQMSPEEKHPSEAFASSSSSLALPPMSNLADRHCWALVRVFPHCLAVFLSTEQRSTVRSTRGRPIR